MALALAVAMATPGPGVMAIISRALALGWRRNLGFIGGMVMGDLIFMLLAAFGLAALAHAAEPLFLALRYLGAAYLVWLGVKAWRAAGGADQAPQTAESGQLRGFAAGLTLTLSNPKTIVFYLALFPAVIELTTLALADVALLMAVSAVILSSIMLAYSVAAGQMRRVFAGPRAAMQMNRGAGTLMIALGIAVAVAPLE